MCDVLGPPSFVCPFQRYNVYRSKNAIYVFGVDKVHKKYSELLIPKQDGSNATLELRGGVERHDGAGYEARLQELKNENGGLEEVAKKASGLVGFIRFLCGYYLILIKSHKKVGKIGHHFVLSIESTTLVPLFSDTGKRDEKMFKDQLNNFDLSKDFYFSYTYELSRTVQQNLADAKCAAHGHLRPLYVEKNASKHHRFVWNHYHMTPFLANEGWQHWCLSIIHGFFAHTKCSSFGWSFEVALIARRSRFYAGTRYRKRGLNVDGQVGNDVETEQLLCDNSLRHLSTGHVMSFVQIRGSVPLFWSQEATAINPKPPVVYPRCDPTLSATRRHFADLLERYGTPQLVVNLMKAKKVDSYEVRLSKNFESSIERMNRELPEKHRILYRPFDMKNHAKSNPTIYEVFARLAESVVTRVGFFHTKTGLQGRPERLQNGVVRTNCVDCLDRTNVLQFFVGLEVLKQQLTAMCLLPEPKMDFESQAVFVLSELYDVMGDHLALQYAGSVAHKKYQLLGSRPRMMTSSKELLTSIHRHYNNSFTDREKQACLNLFLGLYQPAIHPSMEKLDCDSWVHHKVLEDDYNPGEWWEEPLRKHDQNLLPLKSKDPEYNLKLTPDDVQDWFGQLHKAEKYTWFEKLLAHSDATFVQINPASRPLRTVGPYKRYLERKQKEPKQTEPIAAEPSFSLQSMTGEELEVYQTYVDTKKLSRLMWLESTADDQMRSISSLPFYALEAEQPGSDSTSRSRKLLSEEVARATNTLQEELAQLVQIKQEQSRSRSDSAEKDKESEMKLWRDLKRRVRDRVWKLKAPAKGQSLLKPPGPMHPGSVSAASRSRDSASVVLSMRQPGRVRQAEEKKWIMLCECCAKACQAPASPSPVLHTQENMATPKYRSDFRLCARHFDRTRKLQDFMKQAFSTTSGTMLPQEGLPDWSGGIKLVQPKTGDKPWSRWLQVERPVSEDSVVRPRRASDHDSASQRARGDSDRLARPRSRSATVTAMDTAGQPNKLTLATEREQMPLIHQPAEIASSASELQVDLLWSYVFPHEPPVAAKPDDLGLPKWFVEFAKPCKPRVPENVPPVIRTKSLTRPPEQKKTRRISFVAASHARTPSANLLGPGASPKADGAANVGQSIFGGNVQQMLEELAHSAS